MANHLFTRLFLSRPFPLFIFLLTSGNAVACAVCGASDETSRFVYMRSTIILSLVPLATLGIIFYGAYRVYLRENKK